VYAADDDALWILKRRSKPLEAPARKCAFIPALFSLAFVFFVSMAADAQPAPVSYRAFAVNMSNVGRTGADSIDITIDRWTTDAEAALLHDALVEKDSDALLKAIHKIKPRVGAIRRANGGLGWDIQYARRTELPSGGYRVVFATDRPMSFYEAANRPRSADYEFLWAELHIGANGEGEGKLVPRAKITYDKEKRVVEIENYANLPVQLTQVTEVKKRAEH
jgi:hypothetical protein